MRTRLAAGVGAAILTLAVAAPAGAESGYRYWSFWEGPASGTTAGSGSGAVGKWGYASLGPALARPEDGDVVGFRFAVSRDAADATQPSAAPDFARICAGVGKKDGTKRVAVVVDFGGAEDAPTGETPPIPAVRTDCPRVREEATAAEALAAVAKPLRYDSNALLCGISGYPRQGCGEQVTLPDTAPGTKPGTKPTAEPAPSASSSSSSSSASSDTGGPSLGLVAGGAAVLLLGAAGVWQARRRGR
ncbi:SCO2322 family protein [Streptomyces roseicoloratus]|uniref:SCO2322 family protein n=1 Tax=Streptomyces roseicoloratus TaxID=2508722 RepID=A0ABY9RYM9_9ACTN|nr:SCO2322 family protein [Streptomyces roseicoloratus]WMX47286.1 SCO2322 family protein [Streptomyces roseicoloratus]